MVRYTLGFGLVLVAVLLSYAIGREEIWVVCLGFVFLLLISLAWPATYICTSSGLVCQFWWKPQRKLDWGEIVQVEHTQGGDFYIYDRSGRRVCFTRFHVDPATFESTVLRRTGIERAMQSSDPSSIR